jgi:hypothetical protein
LIGTIKTSDKRQKEFKESKQKKNKSKYHTTEAATPN